jgi:hypothetical protein
VSGVNRIDQVGRLADQPIRSLAQRAMGCDDPNSTIMSRTSVVNYQLE